jgi:hypothetical protein
VQGENNSMSPSRASTRNDAGDAKDTMSPQGRLAVNGTAKVDSNESGGASGGGSVASDVPAPSSVRSKPSKSRVEKASLNDLRRRAAAMLSFISRTQVELAGERATNDSAAAAAAVVNMLDAVNGDDGAHPEKALEKVGEVSSEAEFKGLTSTEMMDVLTRKLLKFQQEWGKPGGN